MWRGVVIVRSLPPSPPSALRCPSLFPHLSCCITASSEHSPYTRQTKKQGHCCSVPAVDYMKSTLKRFLLALACNVNPTCCYFMPAVYPAWPRGESVSRVYLLVQRNNNRSERRQYIYTRYLQRNVAYCIKI